MSGWAPAAPPRGPIGLAVAAGVLLAPALALAGAFDLHGYGSRATAMGNAAVAEVDDHTAAFYNPGALTRRKQIHLGVGLLMSRPALTIDRRPATEGFETEEPEGFAGLMIGALFPLGGLLENRVALGFGLYLPSDNLLRAQAIDSVRPQFYMYQNMPDKLTLLVSGAWEVVPALSVGVGVQVLAAIVGSIHLDADVASRRFEQREATFELVPAAAPTAGLHAEPTPGLRLGLAWRGALALEYDIPSHLSLDDVARLDLSIQGTSLYTPHHVTLGVAWDVGDTDWTLAADVTWSHWSAAPDPSPRIGIDIGGRMVDGMGLGEGLDIGRDVPPIDLGFSDTVNPHLGAELRATPAVAVRAGYAFRPTPAPAQTGPTNYVDTDAHVFSVGAGVTFQDPLEMHGNPVALEAVAQWIQHTARTMDKPPGDPVGTYTAGGRVLTVQLGFRHDY